jgi:hypothetical protein
MRAMGCAVGIAIASVTLSWRLFVYTGNGHKTTNVPTNILLAATADILWVLAGFAVAAGSCALLRDAVAQHCKPVIGGVTVNWGGRPRLCETITR